MTKEDVKIIIPIYKNSMTELEKRSLIQAYNVLQKHSIIVIKPESLDLSELLAEYPLLKTESFDDSYFKGIQGYNRLMLSVEFYKRFLDCKYILIYQLDAYVFSDELIYWCNKEYDYVGAPWLRKKAYKLPIISSIISIQKLYSKLRGTKNRFELHNRIGNGGFSLRKVESFYKATLSYKEKINWYLSQKRSHLFNEDVFWGTEIPEFNYPPVNEALKFSFDKYPAYCFELNNKQLPFGCHAWYKKKMMKFWKPIINF